MSEFLIQDINPSQYINQDYTQKDINLLHPLNVNKTFGELNDVIEFFIISPDGNILEKDYNYKNFTNVNNINNSNLYNQIKLNPENDILSYGYDKGEFNVLYNFSRLLFGSSNVLNFFIKEISRDRTELKITTQNIPYLDLQKHFVDYIANRNSRNFYSDFHINFGENNKIIGVNIALDTNTDIPSLFIKLYEPLPSNVNLKDTLWLEEKISDSYSYKLNKDVLINSEDNKLFLKGPNFHIEVNEQLSTTTPYLDINDIIGTNIPTSSYNRIQSLIKDNVNINVDYNNFYNFVHFSSAKERLNNFLYKISKLEQIHNDINTLSNISSSVLSTNISSSIITLNKQIEEITHNFDGYEYFLYYNSGSNSFPKLSGSKPYINVNSTSSIALEWIGSDNEQSQYYGGKILDTSNYDTANKDYIWNNLPEYIKFDEQNAQLELIISMLGQHFDYIWTYIKDITNKDLNDNRIDFGISKDLVAEALKSYGIKLYTNSQNTDNLYSSIIGENPDGTFLPYTGSYKIDNYITASNYTIPSNDINKETYKKIYHNLPYLLKSKGTNKGLRALINCFGISDTLLNIKEFGGNNKNINTPQLTQPKFNYSLNLKNNSYLLIPAHSSYKQYLDTGFDDISYDTIEFRFKFDSILPTQSLLETENDYKFIQVTHTTGSYADIVFTIADINGDYIYSEPINLPIYNNDWWNLSLSRDFGGIRTSNSGSDQNYTLTIGNKDNKGIQYIKSSSLFMNGATSSSYNLTWIDNIFPGGINLRNPFSGSIQELRLWIDPLPLDDFKNHILNPKSISNGSTSGSYEKLIFRAPLGSELDNIISGTLTSIHPNPTQSFWDGSNSHSQIEFINSQNAKYIENNELYFINNPNIGNLTEDNIKVTISEPNIIPGNTLSINTSIVRKNKNNKNVSKLELGISPQNSLNDDIISQLGAFNIDDYMGDPSNSSKTIYPDLISLKNFYFSKIESKTNLFDSIKLLSYLDNSLFKMIKDWVPAKVDLSSGLIIKNSILERNKVQRFEPIIDIDYLEIEIDTAFITGSNGSNSTDNYSNIKPIKSKLGILYLESSDNKESFNGEISGSEITIYNIPLDNKVYESNNIKLDNNDIIKNYSKIILNPILNNVEQSIKSNRRFELDYSLNINNPSNINYITQSLFYNINNDVIKSDIQESNYSLKRHTLPRYEGSKQISKEYNKYNIGDISYGKSPVIDKNGVKFAYFSEITSQSLTLPGRVNTYIKYLIDENSNITELTRQNKNLFDVQVLFDENTSVILDDNKTPSNQQKLDGLKNIFAGGFRYEPILQNIVGTHTQLGYTYENDIQVLNISGSGITENLLSNNSLTIGNPFLQTPLNYNTLNTTSNTLRSASLNSKVLFPITRNTGYSGEIRQRVSGTIEFVTYISPPTNHIVEFWYGQYFLGPKQSMLAPFDFIYDVTGPLQNPLTNVPFYFHDNLQSFKVPAGVSLYLGNYNGPYAGPYTNVDVPFGSCPLCNTSQGVDFIKTTILDCEVDISITNQYNNLDTIMSNELLLINNTDPNNITYTSSSIGNTVNSHLTLDSVNGIGVKITFDVSGYVILPANQNSGNLILKNLLDQDGIISSKINYLNYLQNNVIQFTTPPKLQTQHVYRNGSPFYFGTPPPYLYITGTIDNGFISGSESNYFFKRGIYDEGKYNILTSSYDLSNIYYENKINNNNFTQTFPTFSYLGYEDIENKFEIKTGDLIRFYDYNKTSFPIELEKEVVKIIEPTNPPHPSNITDTNRLYIVVKDSIADQSCSDNPGIPSTHIQNFIILSKIEDETNIVLRTDKNPGKTSSGIIIPDNINKSTKDKAGNIIKQLKVKT